MNLICEQCETVYPFNPTRARCDCGGPCRVAGAPAFDPQRVEREELSLWRYQHAFPLPGGSGRVTLGAGMTPLVAAEWAGRPLLLKCEYLNPTGSFKDRGTAVLVTALAAAGVERVVEDSSGNAGSSLAAYAARAGIWASVYVPAHASPVKQAQIAAYGAGLVRVPGPRTEAARAVLAAADAGAVYASHVYHPLVHHGIKTIAFELYEQWRRAGLDDGGPAAIFLPLGHGSLLLGLVQGLAELQAADCIGRMPRIYGAQASACAPLASAWQQGSSQPVPVEEGETIAEGVRIAAPVRGRAVLAAVRRCGGAILAVAEARTRAAQRRLAHMGFYVEPTSAVAVAALDEMRDRLAGTAVVILTGSGFKSPASG
ncbi:MAG: pyridoxal-phosphate dependent enzyme [Anaerolineae bacterium]|nr:pyridoxal-phosphate dependent enzyme [Anaerolineae bacterium]